MNLQKCIHFLYKIYQAIFLLLSLFFINQLATRFWGGNHDKSLQKKRHMVGSLKIDVHNLLLCPPDVKIPFLFQKTMFCNDRHSRVAVFIHCSFDKFSNSVIREFRIHTKPRMNPALVFGDSIIHSAHGEYTTWLEPLNSFIQILNPMLRGNSFFVTQILAG